MWRMRTGREPPDDRQHAEAILDGRRASRLPAADAYLPSVAFTETDVSLTCLTSTRSEPHWDVDREEGCVCEPKVVGVCGLRRTDRADTIVDPLKIGHCHR